MIESTDDEFTLKYDYKHFCELEHDIKYAFAILRRSKKMHDYAECIKYLESAQEILNDMLLKLEDDEKQNKERR